MIAKVLTLAIGLATVVSGVLQPGIPSWAESKILSAISRGDLAEKQWNFAIKRYRMQHHYGVQMLNIAVDCTSEHDVDAIAWQLSPILHTEIERFLQHYPNEDDYWEIINRELTKTLLRQHPQLSSLTVTLEVLPTTRLPYTRASIVSRTQAGYIDESWRFFTRVPGQWQGQSVSYEVEYFYRDGLTNEEYPDFVPIHRRITQLLTVAVAKGDTWEQVNHTIAQTVLQKYPALDSLTSQIDPPIQKAIEWDALTTARLNSAQ